MREQRSKPAMQDPEYDYYTYRNDEFNRHWEKVTSYTPRKNRKPLWFGIGSLIGVAILFIAGVSTWVLYTRNTPISQIDFAQPTLMPQATPASGYAPQTVNVYTNHHGPVNAVAWSPDGTRIASASDDMTVQVWDALTGNNPFIFSRHTAPVETLAWSPNGQLIASASLDGTIDVWDPNNGRLDLTYHFAQTADVAHIGALQAKSGGDPETFAVAWSHDGSTIAAVMGSSVVRVFDVHSGSTLYTIPQSSKVVAMAWSPNGKYIITADANSTTTIWNASNGTAAFGSMVSNTFVFSLSWSPDSKRVALSYIDGTVQICNPFSNSFLKLTTQSPIYSVAWSPNGARLALAGVDGTNATVQFVDTTSDQTTLVYSGYMNTLRDMAWSPNSSLLAFASSDATVQVWKVA